MSVLLTAIDRAVGTDLAFRIPFLHVKVSLPLRTVRQTVRAARNSFPFRCFVVVVVVVQPGRRTVSSALLVSIVIDTQKDDGPRTSPHTLSVT